LVLETGRRGPHHGYHVNTGRWRGLVWGCKYLISLLWKPLIQLFIFSQKVCKWSILESYYWQDCLKLVAWVVSYQIIVLKYLYCLICHSKFLPSKHIPNFYTVIIAYKHKKEVYWKRNVCPTLVSCVLVSPYIMLQTRYVLTFVMWYTMTV